ncbi:cytochrome P450 [Aspergillus undulatus]|uniref:cytochrome P450 n=1 Tax=Aspergillus undulatus TaxID=1810928 RepID=UPI003CCD8833
MLPLLLVAFILRLLYRLYIHPLSLIPGPKLAACTSLWLAYHTYIGNEASVISALHKEYGRILRIGPNDISISDASVIEPIYVSKGGFPKTPVYSKFDIGGHATIFSTLTLPERASRAKAVAPLFSTSSIKAARGKLLAVVDDFVDRLRREKKSAGGKPVNVLQLTRALAIDAVSSYLFHEQYGALKEDENLNADKKDKPQANYMSASPFVDAYVGVGAFFNFAYGQLGELLVYIVDRFTQPAGTNESFAAMDEYTSRLVNQSVPKSGSYQARLLERVSVTQAQIEVKDVCFAGTDSTGMNVASIIWFLVKEREVYTRLRTALQSHSPTNPTSDPLTTPYLLAVVREGLRLSWANPTRLPRSVPLPGFQYGPYFLPAGTSVGVSSFQLHQDSTVFPDPLSFKPERWLDGNVTDEMLDSFFAFGRGSRACIARNLAGMEVSLAVWRVVISGILKGARVVRNKNGEERIEILEWFNSRVRGEEILVRWDGDGDGETEDIDI